MVTIVSYDIFNDKERNDIRKELKSLGFVGIQKSVYIIDRKLKDSEIKKIKDTYMARKENRMMLVCFNSIRNFDETLNERLLKKSITIL